MLTSPWSAKTRSLEDCSSLGGSPGTIRRLTSFGFRPDDGRNGVAAGTDWVKADSARAFASATWLRFAMIQSDE
jgi:hypothetical protein